MSVPLLALTMIVMITKLVPSFRTMQTRIDAVNRVLREQITGIRGGAGVRARTLRGPTLRRGQRRSHPDALRVGRMTALMIPLVMMIANLTSVAVIWFGGHEIDNGSMGIGSLTAMLSYIMQIHGRDDGVDDRDARPPRRGVVPSASPRSSTPSRRCSRRRTRSQSWTVPRSWKLRDAEFKYPGADESAAARHQLHRRTGQDHPIIGATGSGKTTLLGLIRG